MTGAVNNLLPLPVLLPLLGAGLALALNRRPGAQRVVSTLAVLGVTAVAAVLVGLSDRHGPIVLWVGAWPRAARASPWSPTGSPR